MSENQRNLYIFLSFLGCMTIAVGVYVWGQLSVPTDPPQERVLSVEPHPADLTPIQPPKLERRYRGIVERNFFQPLEGEIPEEKPDEEDVEEPAPTRPSATLHTTSPGAYPDLYAPLPGVPSYGGGPGTPGWSNVPEMPPEPPQPMEPSPPAEAERPEEPSGPPAASVAVTAVVEGGDGRARVLVEDNATGRSRWVEPGGRAFGYEVDYATDKGGVVSKDGRRYVLGVGENKPARPEPEPEPAPETPADSGPATPETTDQGDDAP
jgi:hypothetical protein